MADNSTAKRTAYTVKNTQLGVRGIFSEGATAYVDPGATVLATLTDDEKAMADATTWFEIATASKADQAALNPAPAADTAQS